MTPLMKPGKRITPIVLLLFLLWLLLPGHADGQRVALVLSGGGAKGGGHIGVIRALEKNHVPIHSIAGTSIGAIIGAMYASGYTPDEMETILDSEEFQRWAAGIMNSGYIYLYRKEDPNASWVGLNVNFRKNISALLPTHLISTYEIDYQFMRMLAPANAVSRGNFDSLLVPFRCVASDIDSTRPMILRGGDLSTAVRGSMSLPLVFDPVTIDNRIVFDGGMYNNFPCDVAMRDFKPDVIIGSRVAQRYSNPEADDIVSQLLTMLMERQTDTILYPSSVMIVPNIPSTGLMNFSGTKNMADSGFIATERKMAEIRTLVHDSVSPETMASRRAAFNSRKPEIIIDSIFIKGLNKVQSGYVRQILKHGRKTVTLAELEPEYFRFIDEGFIKRISPAARYNPKTGHYDLYLDIMKADHFGIEFGGNLSLGSINEAFLEIKYKYLWSKALHFMANGYFGKVYASAKVGSRIDFNSKKPWFMELNYTYNTFDYFTNSTFFLDDKTPNYIIESEYFGNLRTGIPITSAGRLALDITYAFTSDRYYQSNVFSRYDTTDQTTFNFFAPTICFELSNLNRKQYASAGARLRLALSYINGREHMIPGSTMYNKNDIVDQHDWFRFRILYDNYFESWGPVKFGFYGEGVMSNQPLFANYTSSMLYAPAFQPLPETGALFMPPFRATNYAAAGLKIVVQVYKKIEYRLEGYLFQPYREILQSTTDNTAYFGRAFTDRAYMASTSMVYNSPLGPLSIGVNYYDKMPESFTFNLNFGYIIFNRRAMP
jgi:NTE family protein